MTSQGTNSDAQPTLPGIVQAPKPRVQSAAAAALGDPPDPRQVPDWVQHLIALQRPLAILDLEATGTAPHRDRIVEISVLKIFPDGRKLLRERRINPGVPIPSDASAVHGIYNDDVAHEPDFPQIATGLAELLRDCDLAGFGIVQFDLPLLRAEFERAGVDFDIEGRRILDAKAIYHHKEPRTLAAAHDFYCGEPLADAHCATADTLATYRVLVSQLLRYPDLPHDLAELHRLSNPRQADFVDSEGKLIWRDGEVYFNFGKHRGVPLREAVTIDYEYVRWLTQKDFRPDFKTIIAGALEGKFPPPRPAPVVSLDLERADTGNGPDGAGAR
jgi:DNA polymerase-3 subunit epsilon